MVAKKGRCKITRPKWIDMFLMEACFWSLRSHDAQTKCGCVLTRDNTILSSGFNGFVRDIEDDVLPNIRPSKYKFMIHAEHNAILNCVRHGISTLDSIAYISGKPCLNCLQYMWQSGIRRIYYTDYSTPKMIEKEDEDFKLLINLLSSRLYLSFVPLTLIDTSYLEDMLNKIRNIKHEEESRPQI